MWTTNKSRWAQISPRPLRVAYLIPLNPSHDLLDALFFESMSRWGGRRTPIVSTDGAKVSVNDWSFLDLWDADLFYSYVDLKDDLRDRIAHCFAPSEIVIHKYYGDGDRPRDFQPSSDILENALKAISVVPRLARMKEIDGSKVHELLDKERWCEIDRDLSDSFGFLSDSILDLSTSPYAKRLSYRKIEQAENIAPRFRGDDQIQYISDVNELETKLSSNKNLLFSSHLSDMMCPYLNVMDERENNWEDHLTIVVGDSVEDRLLYWNSIHRYRSLSVFRSNQIFRFRHGRFEQGTPDWIANLCGGVQNSRHSNGNGAPNVKVISCSIQDDELTRIADEIGKNKHIMVSHERLPVGGAFVNLQRENPRDQVAGAPWPWTAWTWLQGTRKNESIRITNNELDIPCVMPQHVEDFPRGPVTFGDWLIDLQIERIEDHSLYQNIIHCWQFPRRLSLQNGVKLQNYGKRGQRLLPPSARPTERGFLSLWDNHGWKRPTAHLPLDIDAFYRALYYYHPNSAAEQIAKREGRNPCRLTEVSISDKGRDLLGVFKFFDNLNEALQFLTNPFVLKIISNLSPADIAKDPKRIRQLSRELEKRFSKDTIDTLDAQERERASLRILDLTARWVDKAIKSREKASREDFWKALQEISENKGNQDDLEECVKFLRDIGFLIQGYGWKCKRCQHSNWVGLTELTNRLECAICTYQEDAPIGGKSDFHFKLNSFVRAAFSSTSAQGSVVWCLSELLAQAKHSFLLTPTLDIKDDVFFPKKTDLDVLVCIDGKVHCYEVKRSFAGINDAQIEDLIKVAKLIRPDVVGFAIEHPENGDVVLTADKIQRIRDELAYLDVKFSLLQGNAEQNADYDGELPQASGNKMKWTIWTD